METPVLRNPDLFPGPDVLKQALGPKFAVFETLMERFGAMGLEIRWKYYNDGKSWLCNVSHKKKTVCWLSVWEGYFRTGFFFTEKHLEAIAALPIDTGIKEAFFLEKPIGRLLPLSVKVDKGNFEDVLTVAAFKKSLK